MILASNSKIKQTIPVLITIFSLNFTAYAEYSSGTGDSNDSYQIAGQTEIKTGQADARTEEVLITAVFIDNDLVLEVFPFFSKRTGISIIPDESVAGLLNCELKEVPLDRALEIALTGTSYTYKKTPKGYFVYTPEKNAAKPIVVDLTSGPAKQPPSFKLGARGEIDVKKDNDGKYVATTEIKVVLKTAPDKSFAVRNILGNIFLKPSKDGTCGVKAVIKGKAETDTKASSMVMQVLLNLDSTEKRYYLKMVKQSGGKWNKLSVDFHITVPAVVLLDVKTDLGNIEISNLKENIKAVTDLGSIKAVDTTGNLELFTKMGAIEFIALKNLSAKLQAQTKMGEIQSELPLEIDRSDMFKRTAEGTIGSGRDTIRMTTDMGSIRITNKLPESSANDPEPMIPEDAIRNNADKLDTQLIQLEAKALKTGTTLFFIKQDQEGSRFFLKRFETMTTPLSPGSVLDIKSKDGNVTVQGSDTDQCSVTSTFTIKTPSMDQTKDLSKKISLETTPGNKKLTLKTIGPGKTPPNHTYYVDLNINVPRDTTVMLHKEDGDVRITNLKGQIQIGSEDGNITCENVTGDTSLNSEDGDITYKNITGNARITSEDGNVNIMASRLIQLNIKKEDGNIHCDDISGNCDVSMEDGNVTISYAEDTTENCTCIIRGEDGNVKISNGTFAKCQVNRESSAINCNKVRGNLDLKLENGQVVVDYADNVPESCSINAKIEEGNIQLSAPGEMFPADAPSKATKKDEGAEWTTKTDTPSDGVRTVSLRVDEGSIKVEKR